MGSKAPSRFTPIRMLGRGYCHLTHPLALLRLNGPTAISKRATCQDESRFLVQMAPWTSIVLRGHGVEKLDLALHYPSYTR